MKRSLQITFTIFLVLAALLALPGKALAFPPLPSSFYGVVLLNGVSLPDGTVIQALINNTVYASALTQTYNNHSVFALDVPGDDLTTQTIEGGKEGDAVHFKIGGILAEQAGVWHTGTNVQLDLTATSRNTPMPTQPSPTSAASQTPITVIPTQIPPTASVTPSPSPTVTVTATPLPATATPTASLSPTRNLTATEVALDESAPPPGQAATPQSALRWLYALPVLLAMGILYYLFKYLGRHKPQK